MISVIRKDGTQAIVQRDYIRKPGPTRAFDWCAVTSDYEPGHPQGFGETESDAIADLMELLDIGPINRVTVMGVA